MVHFNLDSPTLRDTFNAGKTVEQVIAEVPTPDFSLLEMTEVVGIIRPAESF